MSMNVNPKALKVPLFRRQIATIETTTTTTTSHTVVNLLDEDESMEDAKPRARASRRTRTMPSRKKPPPLTPAESSAVIDLFDDDDDDDDDNDINNGNKRSSPKRARVVHDVEVAVAAAAAAPTTTAAETEDLRRVLDVVPHANKTRIRELLQQYHGNVDRVVSQFFSTMARGQSSGRQDTILLDDEDNNNNSNGSDTKPPAVTTVRREKRVWSYDFMSASSFSATEPYIQEAQQLLMDEFPCLSKDGARRILLSEKGGHWHYAIAHDAIFRAIQGVQEQPDQDLIEAQYNRVQRVFSGHSLTAAQEKGLTEIAPSGRNYVKHPRKRRYNSNNNDDPPLPAVVVTDDVLKEEVTYVKQKMDEWMAMAKNHKERKQNQARAQQTSTGMECSCCFDSFPIEDMCQCREEGHLFCIDCMANFAKVQVFGSGNLGSVDPDTKKPAMDLLCFHPNCHSKFSRDMLVKALPRQTLEKYDELQSQIVLRAAELKDLVSCPKCSFQFLLENPRVKKLHCPVEDCQFDSCRECGLAWHNVNISCEEARQQEYARQGRHKVEEAMTLAKVRNCPACQQPFLKESGCNKISCSKCNTNSCYVCRQAIPKETGYAHFCQEPHCRHQSCKKCPLYTKDEEEQDRTNMRQAGLKAVAHDATVQTDVVDQLLQDGSTKAKRRARRGH